MEKYTQNLYTFCYAGDGRVSKNVLDRHITNNKKGVHKHLKIYQHYGTEIFAKGTIILLG